MTSPTIKARNERIVALWRERRSVKQIAQAEQVSVACVQGVIWQARQLLGSEVIPCRGRSHHDKAFWLEVARLWREGKNGAQIGEVLGYTALQGAVLVGQARYHLGVEQVPKNGAARTGERAYAKRVECQLVKSTKPYTMADVERHYVRRVGPEFIFRDEQGNEEIWVEDPKGLVWHSRRLVFKVKLGAIAQ